MQDRKEVESATFKPTVNPKGSHKKHRVPYAMPNDERKNVIERTAQWEENRKAKINAVKEQKTDEGLEECTFKPKLVSGNGAELSRTVATEAQVNIRSIDKYLERMYAARANKEEKDRAFATGVGSGKAWKNEITIPKAPKLAE